MKDVSNLDSDDEKRVMEMTWKRIEKQHLTDGFREGSLTGKDRYLQANFDRGYEEGIRKSYDVGFQYGEQRILNFIKGKSSTADKDLTHGLCSICTSKSK